MPTSVWKDFEFMAAPKYCAACKVHRGFYSQYLSIRTDTLKVVAQLIESMPQAKVTVMGWSFGGVIATMAAIDIAAAGHSIDMVITMGMPRVGNKAFVDHY